MGVVGWFALGWCREHCLFHMDSAVILLDVLVFLLCVGYIKDENQINRNK